MSYTIETLESQSILGKCTTTSMATIGDDIGRLVGEVCHEVGDKALGPVVVRYLSWTGDGGEMEVAVPVAPGTPGASELPGGRAVVTTHVGSYAGLKDAWGGIRAHVEQNGYASRCAPWEAYLNDCSVTPEDQLQTRIVWPIE